jgi:hypothetical protein
MLNRGCLLAVADRLWINCELGYCIAGSLCLGCGVDQDAGTGGRFVCFVQLTQSRTIMISHGCHITAYHM